MGKVPPPILVSLLVCDQVIIDQRTGKPSVIGIFENISAFKYPANHPKIALFAQFTNGRGQIECEVKITHLRDDERELFKAKGPMAFKDVRQVLPFVFELNGFRFPEPGEYRVQIYANGEMLGEKRIICRKIEKPQKR